MASRQQQHSTDVSKVDLDDEEAIGVPREGDEIMEEAEDHEDGYSTFISCLHDQPPSSLTFHYRGHSKANLTSSCDLAASSTPTSTLTWISWFCSLPGHEYFCEVTEDFIEDDFNLTGLNTMVPFWKEAMEMVLDVEPGVDFVWYHRIE